MGPSIVRRSSEIDTSDGRLISVYPPDRPRVDAMTPAFRTSSRICSRNRFGVPERRAISSMVNASGAGFAASSARASRAFRAYFIFCVIMPKTYRLRGSESIMASGKWRGSRDCG